MGALTAAIVLRRGAFALEAELSAEPGITVLFGRSGAGKTTLLHAILGASTPQSGRIALGERVLFDRRSRTDLPVRQRRIGIVFQESSLFPHLDALGNVAFGARDRDAKRAAATWLDRVGATSLARRLPAELSGGERQRVALARALAARPEALLLDEPFSGLDPASREALGGALLALKRETGIPFLHVTHDPAEALRLGDAVVAIEGGRVTARGAPAEVLGPAGSAAATAGSTNWLAGTVTEDGPDGARVDLGGVEVVLPPIHRSRGAAVVLALPVEEPILAATPVHATSARNVLAGEVVSLASGDGVVDVLVALPVPLRVRITPAAVSALGLRPGARVWVLVKAAGFRVAGGD